MKILILGSGGREHALAMHCSKSPRVEKVFAHPGNVLWQDEKITILGDKTLNVEQEDYFSCLAIQVRENNISLILVGPEAYLERGIVDQLEKELGDFPCLVYAPHKKAAQLESSKAFAKKIMQEAQIPSAEYRVFKSTEQNTLNAFLNNPLWGYPLVIKADGLAAGKGVVIVNNLAQAEQVLKEFWQERSLGSAADQIVLEQYIEGKESSFLLAVWGDDFKILPSAKDYKTLYENGQGPNTGGMGVVVPSPEWNGSLENQTIQQVIIPLLRQLKKEQIFYKGFLYVGLMLNKNGQYVLEFNTRLGDPETQSILPHLDENLIDTFIPLIPNKAHYPAGLLTGKFAVKTGTTLTTVLVAPGYPHKPLKNGITSGIAEVMSIYRQASDVSIILSGIKAGKTPNEPYLIDGGRALGITVRGHDLSECHLKTEQVISQVYWDGMHYRKDIGA